MMQRGFRPFVWLTVFILFVSTACRVGTAPATEAPSQTSPIPPTMQVIETEVVEPTAASSGAISSLDDLGNAVVYIEAQGSYRDPSEGWQVNVGGSGTGFIIDPAGIAVTNNHVVAGSATLKVWLSGETEPRTAKVLGVSECSDLAVLEIEGDNFPYLDWFQGAIKSGNRCLYCRLSHQRCRDWLFAYQGHCLESQRERRLAGRFSGSNYRTYGESKSWQLGRTLGGCKCQSAGCELRLH